MRKWLLTVVLLAPVVISCLLMVAHFMYGGNPLLALVCLAVAFCVFSRSPKAARIVQVFLVLASLEWVRAIFAYVAERQGEGKAWMRLAVILGAVACFTLASSLVFLTKTIKERSGLLKTTDDGVLHDDAGLPDDAKLSDEPES